MKVTFHPALIVSLCASFFAPSLMAQERIVSAGSAVTELILDLGDKQDLVGVDVTSINRDTAQLPHIGYHRQLATEGILALQPTQLIGSTEMGPDTTLNQLRQAGVKVTVLDTDNTSQGLIDRIVQLGKVLHKEEQANQLKQQVIQTLAQLQSGTPTQQKKVLFVLIHEGRAANVAGSGTVPDAIISLAGAVNPASDAVQSYKPLSKEALIEMQPDVVLVSGRSFAQMGGADAILKALPTLTATPAGIHKRIYTIDGHALVGGLGLNSLKQAVALQKQLYLEVN